MFINAQKASRAYKLELTSRAGRAWKKWPRDYSQKLFAQTPCQMPVFSHVYPPWRTLKSRRFASPAPAARPEKNNIFRPLCILRGQLRQFRDTQVDSDRQGSFRWAVPSIMCVIAKLKGELLAVLNKFVVHKSLLILALAEGFIYRPMRKYYMFARCILDCKY